MSLGSIFSELEKTKGLLGSVLEDWQPPKSVVVGGESAGKSTVLEQLLMMPLFARDMSFWTRMALHVCFCRTSRALGVVPTVIMAVLGASHQPAAIVERSYGTPTTLLRKLATTSRDEHA